MAMRQQAALWHVLSFTIFLALVLESRAEYHMSAMGFLAPGIILGKTGGDGHERLEQLNLQLELAVKDERYADAARLKKEIDQIKVDLPPSSGGDNVQTTSSQESERRATTLEELRQREIRRLRDDIDPGGDNMATPW